MTAGTFSEPGFAASAWEPGTSPLLARVRDRYREGDLVLFVGAGASVAAGLPAWRTLAAELIERARQRGDREHIAEMEVLAKQERFMEASTAAATVLGDAEFRCLIKEMLDDRRIVDVPPIMQAIAQLEPRLRAVITTNLDHLLERAFQGRWPARLPAADVGQDKAYILKLHGTLHEPGTWVLTQRSYEEAVHHKLRFEETLTGIFRAQTILFVGYSLSDYHLEPIFAKLRSSPENTPPTHYALMPQSEIKPHQRASLEEAGVLVIPYENHESLPKTLTWLTEDDSDAPPPPSRPGWDRRSRRDTGTRLRAGGTAATRPATNAPRRSSRPPRRQPDASSNQEDTNQEGTSRYLRSWAASGLVLLLLAAAVAAVRMWASGPWQKPARDVADYIQFVGVVVLCARVLRGHLRRPAALDSAFEQANRNVEQFTKYWRFLWVAWVVFYAGHSSRHYLDFIGRPTWGAAWEAGFVILQLFQAWMLLVLFWTMMRPKSAQPKRQHWHYLHEIFVACVVLAMLQFILLLGAGSVFWPSVVVGVFGAATMGMFIGRLASRFLRVHPLELFALFVYASLQPLFRINGWLEGESQFLDSHGASIYTADLIIRALAFAGKIGLFAVVTRQLESGRLAFYMWSTRELDEKAIVEWNEFGSRYLAEAERR